MWGSGLLGTWGSGGVRGAASLLVFNDPFLLEAVIPVGTVGTIHYQLASLPFTSGLSLGLDLDVS